ncbi:hypothetical protein M5K25_025187 [Dendrobium thyrsiflorum]|uniref:RING-type E3 ubiquitin transferase n=1 Tax=Dendrobium thyrsiflorum TaxID=117978 RepID=A0ABD0U3V5_DENTH
MDAAEVEENLFAFSDAKLHGGMCRQLSAILYKILAIFPVLEEARPRSKSGIQALCSLHVNLDKSKNLLQHCSECSKLYLAITGDSILMKFEKARCALQESLTNVQDIVPQAIGYQILEIVGELERTVFILDHVEKKAGDEVISLLQKKNSDGGSSDSVGIEVFHHAVLKLGITSSRAALSERRALNKLIERARAEEDKRKESVVAYLLHLTRKYSKLFRNDTPDDSDSQGSNPCSPTVPGSSDGSNNDFGRQLSRQASFSSKPHNGRSEEIPTPPEEFRCPISLQIMHEPVIISSGQTYERVCIEKWFKDGHHTCPKTQQKLTHFSLTPNFCVKGLIASWCQQNGFPVPDGPPASLDLNSWRLSLPARSASDSRSIGSLKSCDEAAKRTTPEESGGFTEEHIPDDPSNTNTSDATGSKEHEFERYESLLEILRDSKSRTKKHKAIEEIRFLLKDDGEARIYMGANRFVEELVQFLKSATDEGDERAQEVGALALFNLAVNNSRNKDIILSAGVIPLLEKMISNPMTCESATALYLNLSCLERAKPIIASSQAVPILVQLLSPESSHSTSCKHDALFCLFNLSSHAPTVNHLISAGIIDGLYFLLSNNGTPTGSPWSEKALAILASIASCQSAMNEMVSTPGLISSIATALNVGQPPVQEQAVSCLLILCAGDESSCCTVLQEGVIPALVSVSANGTQRGKEKARKLLKLFREQRQREPSPSRESIEARTIGVIETIQEPKPFAKSRSARIVRSVSSFWKPKHRW